MIVLLIKIVSTSIVERSPIFKVGGDVANHAVFNLVSFAAALQKIFTGILNFTYILLLANWRGTQK